MTFKYSTPGRYIKAIKEEKRTWPVFKNDFLPYAMEDHEYWSGYYTSRADLKKQAKDYSSLFHAQNKLFARRMIDQKSTE